MEQNGALGRLPSGAATLPARSSGSPTNPASASSSSSPVSSSHPASLVRRAVLAQLFGDDDLVVIHSGRFSSASTLLRTFAASPPPGATVAAVIAPAPDTTEQEYWSLLLDELGHPPPRPPATEEDGRAAFTAVVEAISEQAEPCVLVLDDLHLIPDAPARVDELLLNAPPAEIRIIVVTRVDGERPGRSPLITKQKFIPTDELNYTPHDIATLFRQSGLDHDGRTPEIVHRLTEGLPALVHAVCSAVPASEIRTPSHLAAHIPPILDQEIDRTIRMGSDLTEHRDALLLSAAADPLTREAAAMLAQGPEDLAEGFTALDRSGMARASGSPGSREWHYPSVVRASLLRIAENELVEELHDYRRDLISLWLHQDRPSRAVKVAGEAHDWPLVLDLVRANFDTLYSSDFATTMDDQVLGRVPEHLVTGDPLLSRMWAMHQQFIAPGDVRGRAPDPWVECDVGGGAGSDMVQEASGSAGADALAEGEGEGEGKGEGRNAPGADEDEQKDDDSLTRETVIRAVELRVHGHFDESAALSAPTITSPLPDLQGLPPAERDATSFSYVQLGISLMMVGRFDEAVTALRYAFLTADEQFIRRDSAGKLALCYFFLSDQSEADWWLAEERRHPALAAGTEALVRPAGDVAAALLSLDRLDAESARSTLDDLGSPANREEFWGFILYAWGHLALLNDSAANGLRFIDSTMLRFTTMRDNGALAGPLLDGVRADLHLACDRPDLGAELVSGSSHPITAPTRARLLLLTDAPGAALGDC